MPNADEPEVAALGRERRLYYALAIVLSVNVLVICGIATFVLLVKYF